MSRLTDLIARAKARDAQLGEDLQREFQALSARRAFGLNFERHHPETVELPGRRVRKGDKVRLLPERGSSAKRDDRLWIVRSIGKVKGGAVARLELLGAAQVETQTVSVDDLVVVAESRDLIHPGLVSTGKVERGGDKPFHTVINGENFHALKALTYTHRGKVDAIYIDPPYNTGAKDWKYNNDYVEKDDSYRHSKWLAFMERRLVLARQLLKPDDSVLIVTIDEKEYLRLGLLMEQVLPEAKIRMISTLINPKGVGVTEGFKRVDEYIFIARFGSQEVTPSTSPRLGSGPMESIAEEVDENEDLVEGEDANAEEVPTRTGLDWQTARRRDLQSVRKTRPAQFYPIYVNEQTGLIEAVGDPIPHEQDRQTAEGRAGCVAVFPVRDDGTEMNWGLLVLRSWIAGKGVTPGRDGRSRVNRNLTLSSILRVDQLRT